MNKKLILFGLLVLSTLGLISCGGDPEDVLAKAYPDNDTYYEVFVRSFADSDGDGVGDFNGITEKLSYFTDLGITALWLMPIHPSPTYHGYDVMDYYDVNPDYGTMEDFDNMVDAAEQVGIKIMLDMVFNHSSTEHPWFQSVLDGDDTYREYYNFVDGSTDTSNLTGSWGQSIWHSTEVGKYCGYFLYTMPDLNLKNDALFDEIIEISKFWIDKGVKGFRLDAVHHFFGENEYIGESSNYLNNIIFLKDYMDEIELYSEDVFVTGEVFEDQLYQVVGDYFGAVDSPLDFPVATQIRSASQKPSNRRYATVLEDYYDYYRRINSDFVSSPFIVNHDMNRFATQVYGDMESLKLSAEMLLVLPGSPIIYYGEELGMYGYKASGPDIWDETRRTELIWGDEFQADWISSSHQTLSNVDAQNEELDNVYEQLEDEDSLLNLYKTMLHLRNDNIALKYGNSFVKWSDSTSSLQGFIREFEHEDLYQKLLIIHNFDTSEVDMIDVEGELIYISGISDLSNVTKIPPKSTVIIEMAEE